MMANQGNSSIVLTYEEINNNFNLDKKATSNIEIDNIGRKISLTPIEIVMRDQTSEIINETNFNIIVNLHPNYGTHWVLVISRDGCEDYYFDSFGVETPPIFLEKNIDPGSDESIQKYDEPFCGAFCI